MNIKKKQCPKKFRNINFNLEKFAIKEKFLYPYITGDCEDKISEYIPEEIMRINGWM